MTNELISNKTISSFFFPLFQSDHQGIDGSFKSGSISALQHSSSTDPGSDDPTSPHPFLAHHSRIRIAGHRRSPHSSPCKTFYTKLVWDFEFILKHDQQFSHETLSNEAALIRNKYYIVCYRFRLTNRDDYF